MNQATYVKLKCSRNLIISLGNWKSEIMLTLESELNVRSGISVRVGKLDKNNKYRVLIRHTSRIFSQNI